MKITVEQAAPSEPEDIFYRGNLVVHKDSTEFILLVISSGNDEFDAVRVTKWFDMPFGEHCSLYKDQFVQFHGKITFECRITSYAV